MEEQKDVNVNPVPETNETVNVDKSVESTRGGEIEQTTPIQEKLADIEEKQNMVIPEVVKEVAEPVIAAASAAAGETKVNTEKVSVKKPTKKDPIIMYGDKVVMWYIDV